MTKLIFVIEQVKCNINDFELFPTYLFYIFRDILAAMQDPNAGVPLDNHYCRPENKTHKLCFSGNALNVSS